MTVKKAPKPAESKQPARATRAKPAEQPDPMHSLALHWARELDAIDKGMRLRAGQERLMDPISTGTLCIDWVLGGGARTVFNQVASFEGGSKTTLCMSTFGNAVRMDVPMIGYADAEGSLVPDYADAILNGFGLKDVFNDATRRYYSTSVLEDMINQLARYIRKLPDKGYNEDIGSWCYYVPKGHVAWSKTIAALKDAGLREDKTASQDNWWAFPTDYGGPECAWFIDSWAAAIPEDVDNLIDNPKGSGAGLAVVARALSEELPKISGRLKRKGVMLLSTNQLRHAPMAFPPIKEYGGVALMNHTMVRCQLSERAVPEGWDRDPQSGKQCIEETVSGEGYDRYVFRHVRNTKNKVARPFLDTMTRIWVSDGEGKPHGYDPVFDTFSHLTTTGQLEGSRKRGFVIRFRPSVKGSALQLDGLQLDWMTFKELIVYEHFREKEKLRDLLTDLGLSKPPNLRDALFHQLRTDPSLWGDVVPRDKEED